MVNNKKYLINRIYNQIKNKIKRKINYDTDIFRSPARFGCKSGERSLVSGGAFCFGPGPAGGPNGTKCRCNFPWCFFSSRPVDDLFLLEQVNEVNETPKKPNIKKTAAARTVFWVCGGWVECMTRRLKTCKRVSKHAKLFDNSQK